MPTSGASPTDTVWSDGYMFGRAFGTTPYDVPFGALQGITLQDSAGFKELQGPGYFTPIAKRQVDRKVSISAKWAKIRCRALMTVLGGAVATNAGKSTFTAKSTDERPAFDLQMKGPADGSEVQLNVYNCVCPSLNIPLDMKDFSIPDFSAEVEGKATGELYELILPGDQTTS